MINSNGEFDETCHEIMDKLIDLEQAIQLGHLSIRPNGDALFFILADLKEARERINLIRAVVGGL